MICKKHNCRKYDTKCLTFEFTKEERLRCLISVQMLAADSMKPYKLKEHLETVQAECAGKTPQFFCGKLNE
jgi:hypothetical protein